MRKSAIVTLSAALAAGVSFVVINPATAATAQQSSAKSAEANSLALPAGIAAKSLNQEQSIHASLRTVTQDALTRDDFGKIVDNFAAEDRDRMKDYKSQDFKVLDGVINQISADWHQKYGHDFDIRTAKNVFAAPVEIAEGAVTDAKIAAGNFPAPAEMAGTAKLASSVQKAIGDADQAIRKDLQDSKGVALVRLPAEGNLPEVTASLIQEGSDWRIAVPDTLTSRQIHDQLQNQLTYFARDMKQWPSDETEAYRQFSHQVIMALYDVNAPKAEMRKQ